MSKATGLKVLEREPAWCGTDVFSFPDLVGKNTYLNAGIYIVIRIKYKWFYPDKHREEVVFSILKEKGGKDKIIGYLSKIRIPAWPADTNSKKKKRLSL